MSNRAHVRPKRAHVRHDIEKKILASSRPCERCDEPATILTHCGSYLCEKHWKQG